MQLGFGRSFADLYSHPGLKAIDNIFCGFLGEHDAEMAKTLKDARSSGLKDSRSALLIALGPWVEEFIGRLFGIEGAMRDLQIAHNDLAPIYNCRRQFVQRRAMRHLKADAARGLDGQSLEKKITAEIGVNPSTNPLAFAKAVVEFEDKDDDDNLRLALSWCAWVLHSSDGKKIRENNILFKLPEKIDYHNLVPLTSEKRADKNGIDVAVHRSQDHHHRQGFSLTDSGMDLGAALAEAHYCIFCHNQGKDSCSKGFVADDGYRENIFGEPMTGCPLEEKISEMNLLKSQGLPVAALAVAVVDNPMIAGTGHRICNDCMKSCIYQKQSPVDIPQVETRTLKDILDLPWGFEIYSLLTRWNPMNIDRPLPRADTGRTVLVVGLGPSGYTLAHHLLNDGHHVVAIDGLKIEPLAPRLSGRDEKGKAVDFDPIEDWHSLRQDLNTRPGSGFGGVAEYGITVRWDKNFLTVIRLLLERRRQFLMHGGVRFGSQISADDAFAMGFDHIALCAGAGKPTVIGMKNGFAPGVRQASDFLMALQLTGAAREDSISNLQLRLPVVVIGGGLTAIDTATESLAYYPVQVEKFASRYARLVALYGQDRVVKGWKKFEHEIAKEFLTHAKAIKQEKRLAERQGRKPDITALLNAWGGVTIAYRRHLTSAPSYTLNHEEVRLAMREGIIFAQYLSPKAVDIDDFGQASALQCDQMVIDDQGKLRPSGQKVTLPARSILVAAGTQPNTVMAREYAGTFHLQGRYFQATTIDGAVVEPQPWAKPDPVAVMTARCDDGRSISFFGDMHPSYAGNVVRAMASAKQGYSHITKVLKSLRPASVSPKQLFTQSLDQWRAEVVRVERLTPTIVEVVVRAPAAAKAFYPGQFYRLQNFESYALKSGSTILAMEGMAMTGAWVDREKGLLSTIVLEMGGSSDLCAFLKPSEPLILMGPTGMPTEIVDGESVLLVGGGLGNAVLFSIGAQMRVQGAKVLYIAGYAKHDDMYKQSMIEAAADQIIWCCDHAPTITSRRPQDQVFVGNVVQALESYGRGDFKTSGDTISLEQIDRMVVIGSDGMMAAVAKACAGSLKPLLVKNPVTIGSINSPMQCMMKEICAQCLQVHKNPETGEEEVVYSCYNQDQPLDRVDFDCLRDRLGQNSIQEKLTALWIHRCLEQVNTP